MSQLYITNYKIPTLKEPCYHGDTWGNIVVIYHCAIFILITSEVRWWWYILLIPSSISMGCDWSVSSRGIKYINIKSINLNVHTWYINVSWFIVQCFISKERMALQIAIVIYLFCNSVESFSASFKALTNFPISRNPSNDFYIK